MALPDPTPVLLTYFVHSTALALAGLLLVRGLRSPEARVVALRWSLVGALITTGVALLRPEASVAISNPVPAGPAAESPMSDTRVGLVGLDVAAGHIPVFGAAQSAPRDAGGWAAGTPTLAWLVLLLGIVRLVRRALRGGRTLAGRIPLHDPRLLASIARFGGRVEVRFSESPRIEAPFAYGRREIVLPSGLLQSLGGAERDAMLAHELGHLERRDPFWLGFARVVQSVAWFQPLNRSVLRNMERETEFAADGWALRATRDPLALARVLEHVGQRVATSSPLLLGAGIGGSPLVERVERVLGARVEDSGARRRAGAALMAGTLLGLGFAGPTLCWTQDPAPSRAPAGQAEKWKQLENLAVVPCDAPGATEGETRTLVNIDATGRWIGLVQAENEDLRAARLRFVQALTKPMRHVKTGVLFEPKVTSDRRSVELEGTQGPEIADDRCLLRVHPDAPFSSIQFFMENCGDTRVQAPKVEFMNAADDQARIVQVFLPYDTGLTGEESELENPIPVEQIEEEPETGPGGDDDLQPRIDILMRMTEVNDRPQCTYQIGPKRMVSGQDALEVALGLIESSGAGVTIDARRGVRFGDVWPLVVELRAKEISVVFVGAYPEGVR